MKEATSLDLVRDLLRPSAETDNLSARVDALTTLVHDLLCEVEALRQVHAEESKYRDAYRAACLLNHNNAGPWSGTEKMIARY